MTEHTAEAIAAYPDPPLGKFGWTLDQRTAYDRGRSECVTVLPQPDNNEKERLLLSIFDEGRMLANMLVPGEDLMLSRGEGALQLAFSLLARQAIEDVYADCGDSDAGVLATNVGMRIAREVHAVLFPDLAPALAAARKEEREAVANECIKIAQGVVHNEPPAYRIDQIKIRILNRFVYTSSLPTEKSE